MDTDQIDDITEFNSTGDEDIQEDAGNRERFTVFRGVQSVAIIAMLIATVLTLWNPRKVFSAPNIYDLFQSQSDQETSHQSKSGVGGSQKVGILAGYWQNSTGEVCEDGTLEADVNYEIANRVKLHLEEIDYQVDLFPEFAVDLINYEAGGLIAIYSGSCLEDPAPPSGFKIGTSLTTKNLDEVNNLAVCVAENYQEKTNLPFTYEVIHPDHQTYHILRDIHPDTPALIIEIGSLSTDRDLIINQSTSVVEGIAGGIVCFLEINSGPIK